MMGRHLTIEEKKHIHQNMHNNIHAIEQYKYELQGMLEHAFMKCARFASVYANCTNNMGGNNASDSAINYSSMLLSDLQMTIERYSHQIPEEVGDLIEIIMGKWEDTGDNREKLQRVNILDIRK